MRHVFQAAVLALALAGCGSLSGDKTSRFINDDIARAFIPIDGRTMLVMPNSASGFVIEPGIGVTNAHVAGFIGDRPLIGVSHDYDLLFFRVASQQAPLSGSPRIGEQVVAYGHELDGTVRVAHGVVRGLDMPVKARCRTCMVQLSFVYEGNAGPGFSGGPVVDAASGEVVGITFGYDDVNGHRLMYAYPMSRVRNELAAILHRLPSDVN
jgi:hypothetical protein